MDQSVKSLLLPILLLMLMAIAEAGPPIVSLASETPETPKTSETPKTPETPKSPETPGTPQTPKTPKTPKSPKTPETPKTPKTPETPETPKTPKSPKTPPPPPLIYSSPPLPSPASTPIPPTPPSTSTPHSSTPPPLSPSPPSPTPPTPTTSTPPPSTPNPPTPSSPSPTPPSTTPPSSPSPPPPSSTPSPPSPSTPTTTPPYSSPPPPPHHNPSPPTSSFPPPSPPSTSPKTVRCKNKNYPQCYDMEQVCPSSCPGGCEVDCVTCKPLCRCDRPGAVCQDPRFIGGDGITFYFHGKKHRNFCLVSDSNLHINAHFIGRRNQNMKRDFTWVQSIGILFGKHQLLVGAQKTATWDDSVDRLALSFGGEPIVLPESEAARWQSSSSPSVVIIRLADTNSVMVEVEGSLRITAKVVPITEQDSRIHNYGITRGDSFVHLDLGFKFFSLSNEASGVLGQTYRPDYMSRVNVQANMPVMGGDKDFETSSLFAADCAVARFGGSDHGGASMEGMELSCASGMEGQGVVCKR